MEHVQPEQGGGDPRDETRPGSHVDPEVLALLALGEDAGDASDRDHLVVCTPCVEEVASFAAVVSVGRAVTPVDSPVSPPPAVWNAIRAELGLSADLHPDGSRPRAESGAPSSAASGASFDVPDSSTATATNVTPLRAGGRRGAGARLPWLVGAAAAGVLVGGAGGALIAAGGPDADEEPSLLTQVSLDPLPGFEGASGDAAVHQAADGTRLLVVELAGEVQSDGYREVWLIDRDVQRMVSLGSLRGSSGTLVIPDGVDLGEYPVVDVSDEPYDGNPLHSGVSVIRGVLDA